MANPHFPFTEVQLFLYPNFYYSKTTAFVIIPCTNCTFQIISEFLISKDKPVSQFKRRQPNILLMQVNI